MSSRDTILSAVRANRPVGPHPLPELPLFPLDDGGDRVAFFRQSLEGMGGRSWIGKAVDAVGTLFPQAGAVASLVLEITGNREVTAQTRPRDLADIDVAVVRAAFGVAETGSVLLTDQALVVNAVAYLAQNLLVVLDPSDIIRTMQEAYRRPEFHQQRYASFHTGPSATADIEGILMHGAQGVRSLTVLLPES